MTYLDFLRIALLKASKIAKDYFGKTTSKLKKDNTVVTEADFAVGKFIIQEIEKAFPSYNIINEETGAVDNGSEFSFVIDPIDGTSNFSQGLPHYGVMLGLLKESEVIAGGVILPYFNKLYLAEKGKGATCNGEKIEVSKELNLKKLLIAFGFGYKSSDQKEIFKQTNLVAKLLLECRDLRITNSVYDLMMVAEGKYGGIICGGKIWDHIAPEIIIKEAGGEYSDFFGKPLGYSNPLADLDKQYSIFSAAPEIHKKLQDIINKNA